jgi:tRNA modification GTPase
MTGPYVESDTIFAAASGAGQAAITVVRLSGPKAGDVLSALCAPQPRPREARLRSLRNASGELLDHAIALWLPGPGSFTGEDSAELHLHGGRAVLAAVAGALVDAGARPAEPGEFSRRAFLNGKMDLLEAESIADLIAAETDAQRRQALRQMDGSLGDLYRGWAERLLHLLAAQEALIDFPDDDLPPEVEEAAAAHLAALRHEIAAHLADARGERLRDGLVFAIVGPVNAGKSTLVNALARRDAAITSASPGTTRDVLEVRVDIAGVPVTFLDTAGLRDTDDPVEAEGVRRARARMEHADLVLHLSASGDAPPTTATPILAIDTKTDLHPARRQGAIGISATTGDGMDALLATLAAWVADLTQASGPPPLTRARHRAALTEASACLARAATAGLPELRAEDLRLAQRALGRITGAVGVEDLLDSLFRQFCIGK